MRGGHSSRIAAVACGLLAATVFALIVVDVNWGTLISSWDSWATETVVGLRASWADRLVWGATLLGNAPLLAALACAAAVLLVARRRWRAAVLLAVGLGLGQAVASGAKMVFERARPPADLALIHQPASFSLPSGHAFMTLVFASLMVLIVAGCLEDGRASDPFPGPAAPTAERRRWKLHGIVAVAGILVLAIGASRVYLGVHWVSDVVAGWALGIVWVLIVTVLARRLDRWSRRRRPHEMPARRSVPAVSTRTEPPRCGWALEAVLAVIVAAVAVVTAFVDPLV